MFKIIMVSPLPPWHSGGIERLVNEITTRLQKDFDMVVYCTGDKPGVYNQDKVQVQVFKGYTEVYSPSLSMYRTLKKAKCDLIHAHDFQSFVPLAASLAKRGRQLVLNPHFHLYGSTRFYSGIRKIYDPLIGNFVFKNADITVCFSETEKQIACNRFHVTSDKIRVIYNGVNIHEIENAKPYNLEGKIILYAGRLEKYKNVQMIIESVKHLPDDYVLCVIGIGRYERQLRRLVDKLDLKERVRFLGYLKDRKMYRWLKTCSVFVQLSEIESGMSIMCIEALAAGKPVIVNDSFLGLKETADLFAGKGVFPFNVKKSSPQELATLIYGIDSCINVDLSAFDWDAIARKYENTYRLLLGSS